VTHRIVLAPHPDDEVLGASTVLRAGTVTVVHVTDGVPPWVGGTERPALLALRRHECEAAWRVLGVDPVDTVRLGFDDLTVWRSVAPVAGALTALLADLAPATVHVPAHQQGHPDHDATFAAALLARRTTCPRHRWRTYGLYGYDTAARLRFGSLDAATYPGSATIGSDRAALDRKAAALRCFASQLRPGSVVQRWLDDPVAETHGPLPARLPAATGPCFYDHELDFATYGASSAAVQAELDRALDSQR
jgi:LmbE family N-acetylglucosaminyl deacetylase